MADATISKRKVHQMMQQKYGASQHKRLQKIKVFEILGNGYKMPTSCPNFNLFDYSMLAFLPPVGIACEGLIARLGPRSAAMQ
jgi:hypothetical protein